LLKEKVGTTASILTVVVTGSVVDVEVFVVTAFVNVEDVIKVVVSVCSVLVTDTAVSEDATEISSFLEVLDNSSETHPYKQKLDTSDNAIALRSFFI
jgi:hypothetical protein